MEDRGGRPSPAVREDARGRRPAAPQEHAPRRAQGRVRQLRSRPPRVGPFFELILPFAELANLLPRSLPTLSFSQNFSACFLHQNFCHDPISMTLGFSIFRPAFSVCQGAYLPILSKFSINPLI